MQDRRKTLRDSFAPQHPHLFALIDHIQTELDAGVRKSATPAEILMLQTLYYQVIEKGVPSDELLAALDSLPCGIRVMKGALERATGEMLVHYNCLEDGPGTR